MAKDDTDRSSNSHRRESLSDGQEHVLAQQREFLPQFVLHLDAVQVRRNRQTLKNILTEENAVVLLHVDQLDRKHVESSARSRRGS